MAYNQYVIGDVHGEFDTLLALIEKLPKEHELIFVGDLIDRGPKSKEVISYIKNNNIACVLGNHEELMIEYGDIFIKAFFNNEKEIHYLCSRWVRNGGKETLMSYDLAHIQDNLLCIKQNQSAIFEFIEDINWLKSLPSYIQLDSFKNNKPVVITHASASSVWHLREDEKTFRETALWSRIEPKKDTPIFNIYGHTPVEEINLNQHFINVDTGCTYGLEMGFGELSAYCVQTEEIIQQKRIRKV